MNLVDQYPLVSFGFDVRGPQRAGEYSFYEMLNELDEIIPQMNRGGFWQIQDAVIPSWAGVRSGRAFYSVTSGSWREVILSGQFRRGFIRVFRDRISVQLWYIHNVSKSMTTKFDVFYVKGGYREYRRKIQEERSASDQDGLQHEQ